MSDDDVRKWLLKQECLQLLVKGCNRRCNWTWTSKVQVYWEAVLSTWPGGSKASVTKRVVRPWNSTRSVGGRAESTSWTFRNQVYVVSQVRKCLAGQRRVNETCQLEVDTSLDRKPLYCIGYCGLSVSLCADVCDVVRFFQWWTVQHVTVRPQEAPWWVGMLNSFFLLDSNFDCTKIWTQTLFMYLTWSYHYSEHRA